MPRKPATPRKPTKHAPIHPGELLKHDFMVPMGITDYRLAKDIGITAQQIGRIVHGTRNIIADTALRLARYFGTSAELWMDLQARYDLDRVRDEHGPDIDRITPHADK